MVDADQRVFWGLASEIFPTERMRIRILVKVERQKDYAQCLVNLTMTAIRLVNNRQKPPTLDLPLEILNLGSWYGC